MLVFATPQQAHKWRNELVDKKIGLVPTMGALHQGHSSLVSCCLRDNDITIVSIFVNPLQFNDQSDFDNYPNTFEEDCAVLKSLGVDAVFTGSIEDFFPNGPKLIDAGPFAQGLEGDHRPGHFDGVRAIVKELFQFIKPHTAYFGQKDLQQTLVIQSLVEELGYPNLYIAPTIRDEYGLALSSRNRRLSQFGLERARVIYATLSEVKNKYQNGERDTKTLEDTMTSILEDAGLEIDYCAIRSATAWSTRPKSINDHAYALIAAYVEGVRLIDNIKL